MAMTHHKQDLERRIQGDDFAGRLHDLPSDRAILKHHCCCERTSKVNPCDIKLLPSGMK
ncbi:hypothetical protein HPP92_018244 [Vanilla planifolia]|uniref:Uncharacterized protein n=1 Tax=Vanilla planifolia TaxID=51239 RepID=A0A835QBN0_VANPL|nr:hypothetical protein HPP92_018244 [Vanilla planifolia]